MHVIHVYVTRILEMVIYGLSRGNHFCVIMRGVYPLKFITLYLRSLE